MTLKKQRDYIVAWHSNKANEWIRQNTDGMSDKDIDDWVTKAPNRVKKIYLS